MADRDDLGLFQGFGIEIEYMLVDADSLDVSPVADRILEARAGEGASEVQRETVSWSNELVNHVIELKTSGPAPSLTDLHRAFASEVDQIRDEARQLGADLLPGAMHPWFDPSAGITLFPHGEKEIYRAFDAIFGCRHHGFSNLQSMHINLPFQGDAEFGRLHAAIRAVLPLVPGLAAASPLMEGRLTGNSDHRLAVYANNCARIPSVTGQIIPEPVYSIGDYHDLLAGLYRDIRPHDPKGLLCHEWLNARGAIARFDRNCIEIRVVDAQEAPCADLAIAELLVATISALCQERWCDMPTLRQLDTGLLSRGLRAAMREAETCAFGERELLRCFGLAGSDWRLGRVWSALAEQVADQISADGQRSIEAILSQGTLATRLVRALHLSPGEVAPSRRQLERVYRACAEALAENRMYLP